MNQHLKVSRNDDKLPKSICKIVNDVIKSKTDTQNILFGNLGKKYSSAIANDIASCIDGQISSVITDFRVKMVETKLWKASIMILIFDTIDETQILKFIGNNWKTTTFNHEAKVFCILAGSSSSKNRIRALEVFTNFGFLNLAMVHMTSLGVISYEIVGSLAYRGRTIRDPENSISVFPDKLKNLEGYHYKILIYYQPPSITPTRFLPPTLYFLKAIATVQNAKFKIFYTPNSTELLTFWVKHQMDLTLNTAMVVKIPSPKLFTYEKKNYCALVPIPPKASLFKLIFIKPFDSLTWMLFGLSIISSVAVWRMFRDRGAVDSHWQLAVGIFTMFIGQGADFSRRNRFVLAVLLNIICLSIFILSNLYEGVITSYMIEPAHENRLQTVQELIASDYEIMSGDELKTTNSLDAIKSRLNMSGIMMGDDDGKHVTDQHYVFIRTCDVAKITLSTKLQNGRHVSDYYYLLPEELTWTFVKLEASYLNPFITRLQYYMDLSFQAGLPHMWKVFVSQGYSDVTNSQSRDDKDYLELIDLIPVFAILLVGCGLSAFVLLLEIFCRDCLENLDMRLIGRSCWNWIKRRMCKNKSKKLKIRKIMVKPRHQNP